MSQIINDIPNNKNDKAQPFDTLLIEKLLQQINRKFSVVDTKFGQNEATTSRILPKQNNTSPADVVPLSFRARPCDAAADIIGKDLASEFLKLLLVYTSLETSEKPSSTGEDDTIRSSTTLTSSSKMSSNNTTKKSWMSVQEKVLKCLCNENLVASVSYSFFEELIRFLTRYNTYSRKLAGMENNGKAHDQDVKDEVGSYNTRSFSLKRHFDFLSQWLICVDEVAYQAQRSKKLYPISRGSFRSTSSIVVALHGCIRTYALYITIVSSVHALKQKQLREEPNNRWQHELDSQQTLEIHQTWQRLQSISCRLHVTIDTINFALLEHQQTTETIFKDISILQKAAYTLAPLLSSTFLSNQTNKLSFGVKQKVLSHVHRHVWGIWNQYQTERKNQRQWRTFNDDPDYESYYTTDDDIVIDLIRDCMKWLQFMTELLDVFLCNSGCAIEVWGHNSSSDSDEHFEEGMSALTIAMEWLSELIAFAWFPMEQTVSLVSNHTGITESEHKNHGFVQLHAIISNWISSQLLRLHIPRILAASHYTPTVEGVSQYNLLECVVDFLRAADEQFMQVNDGTSALIPLVHLDAVTAFHLCSFLMATPVGRDRALLLEVLFHCIRNSISLDSTTISMIRAVSVQVAHDESCDSVASELQTILENVAKNGHYYTINGGSQYLYNTSQTIKTNKNHQHLIEFATNWKSLDCSVENDQGKQDIFLSLTSAIARISSFSKTNFTALQQTSTLLYGITLLECCADLESEELAFQFLHRLISHYPHLSLSLLTVVSVRLNQASYQQNGKTLLRSLEFMCTSLVSDSQSAQEVWHLVGNQWMNPQNSPITLRIALIRLFPMLIQGNKRMYRRIIDCLAQSLSGKEIGIRLAAAATIADLAKMDQIRDVSDVIGHIQGLLTITDDSTISLTPIHSLLVHYALLSLHYLVVADELEFDVVIQVLKKKLCSVTDLTALMKLPLVVLESFMLLLGDGECSNNNDDSDDEHSEADHRHVPKIVSTHVRASVQALIYVARFIGGNEFESESHKRNTSTSDLIFRVQINALHSLSRYSLQALGVDDEGLNAAVAMANAVDGNVQYKDAAERYIELRDLVTESLEEIPTDIDAEFLNSLQELARKLVQFEEECLGASLWQKRGKSRVGRQVDHRTGSKQRPQKRIEFVHESLSFLPSPSEAKDLISNNASPSSAIVQLMTSDGTVLTVLRDNADASIETTDPLLLVFALQGYLHITSCFVSCRSHLVQNIIKEVKCWREIFISTDAMFLALCCLCIYISQDEHNEDNPKPIVEEVFEAAMDASMSHGFHRGDISNICLGLLGVSSLRYAEIDRIHQIVDVLEQTVSGYGGQHSFGAFFGLSLIAKGASYYCEHRQCSITTQDLCRLITRITGFIVESLLGCFEVPSEISTSVLACLKSGFATSDLISIVSKPGTDAIPTLISRKQMAYDLFICCSISLPSLVKVGGDLLVAMFYLLDSFEWGTGKGLAMQPVLMTCKTSSLLTSDQIDDLFSGYVTLFEGRLDTSEKEIESYGLGDIFYVLNGPYWAPTPRDVRSLMVENRTVLEATEFKACLLAIVNSITSCFCLGGTDILTLGRLNSKVLGSNVAEIVTCLCDIAKWSSGDDNADISGFCRIIVGFLSSINHIMQQPDDEVKNLTTDKSLLRLALMDVEFSRLPRSINGTLIALILDTIEHLLDDKDGYAACEAKLARAIECIHSISVPGNYAFAFLEPLMKGNMAQRACMLFLCLQIVGRRRVYVDGSDYTKLVCSICSGSSFGLFNNTRKGSTFEVLLENLHDIVSKIPVEKLSSCLSFLWGCCGDLRNFHEGRQMIILFLSSMRKILLSKTPSFKTLSCVRVFVLEKICLDIGTQDLDLLTIKTNQADESVLDVLAGCLKEIPLAMLDEASFFSKASGVEGLMSEAFRVCVTLELIKLEYFESSKRSLLEFSNVTTWLSKKLIAKAETDDTTSYKRIACLFAFVLNEKHNLQWQHEALTSIFDVLLLTKEAERIKLGLLWLGAVLAYACDGNGSDADLSLCFLCVIESGSNYTLPANALHQLSSILVTELPYNLACVARTEKKLSNLFANYFLRLYDHWAKICIDDDILDCVRRVIVLHGSASTSYEEATIAITSSLLTRNMCPLT